MKERVFVTGLGLVCGLGLHWSEVWEKMLAGESAIRAWQPDGVNAYPVKYAAPVDMAAFEHRYGVIGGDNGDLSLPNERRTRFGLAAALQAVEDAGLVEGGPRMGVAIGSGVPERSIADMLLAVGPNGPDWQHLYRQRAALNSALRHGNDHLAGLIARRYDARALTLNTSTACAGAAHAIGVAFRAIRRGEVDCMIAGGADSVLNMLTMTALNLLGAPSIATRFGDKLCRPFDRQRSGFVAGEGGGIVILESETSARRRGAKIYAEVCGFGSSLDAYAVTAPRPDGSGAAMAMQRAIDDARLAKTDIGYINAHGTSTPLNDAAETLAIKTVFSDGAHFKTLAVSANKSMLGHLIAAAGAPEFIATCLSLAQGKITPTINLERADPECDLDYVPGVARAVPLMAALSNSFGFGGLNTCLALKRHQENCA